MVAGSLVLPRHSYSVLSIYSENIGCLRLLDFLLFLISLTNLIDVLIMDES
jgi:hypothetical protein